jgi:hypothetical protein
MKQFLINILLFTLLLAVYTFIVNLLPVKELSGNDHNLQKEKYFYSIKNNYNTIFLGSSRTFRHINPAVFDSILNSRNIPVKSFNFGTPATYYPECFYILNKLVDNNNHLQYVFLELQQVNDIGKINLFASKTYYYLNLKYLDFVTQYAIFSQMNLLHKLSFTGKYYLAYLYKLFAGKYNAILQKQSSGKYVLGKNKNGFLSLDEHINLKTAEYKEINNNRKKLLKDTLALKKRAEISVNQFSNKTAYNNAFFTNYLINLVNQLAQNNIHLYFIIPPRLKSYHEFISLQNSEIANRIIQLADASEFPMFYQFKYSFDIGHLNEQGANIYTQILAEKFIKILSFD